jgi:hypothetical protein
MYEIRKKLIVAVVSFLLFIVPGALADTVILKNGRKLKVEKIWQKGDQICFIFHGVKVVIPQSKISRIESGSDDLKTLRRKSGEDVTRGQAKEAAQMDLNASGAVTPTELYAALRKDGFWDLQWGRKVSSVDGLKKKQTVSDLDDVVEYIRPKDLFQIGGIALVSVNYAFWRDQLYTVTLWTKGYPNFTALRDAAIKKFGPGIRNDSTRERYVWSDALSDIMLDYIQDGRYGMLWLRSKELDHQCKSSQLKGHASYLKWMRSRD